MPAAEVPAKQSAPIIGFVSPITPFFLGTGVGKPNPGISLQG